jgi:hypothetical protein
MQYLGFIFELLFFVAGFYLYLLSAGHVKVKDNPQSQSMQAWILENKYWLKPAALLLMAIMGMNIVLALMGK